MLSYECHYNIMRNIYLIILMIIFCGIISNSKFLITNRAYNGSMSYNGIYNACTREYNNSIPCSMINLMNEFWEYNLITSWILSLDNNCIGYSSDSDYSQGNCIMQGQKYITTCTCDMNIYVCCYI